MRGDQAWRLPLVRVFSVVVQQRRWSQHRRARCDEVVLLRDIFVEHRLLVRRERFLEFLLLHAMQVEANLCGHFENLFSGVTVTFDILLDQLFDPRFIQSERARFVSHRDRDLSVERLREQFFEVRHE